MRGAQCLRSQVQAPLAATQRCGLRRQAFQPFTDSRACKEMAQLPLPRRGVVARVADSESTSDGGSGAKSASESSEDGEPTESVLERLQKAEKEAADLRYQLTLARDMQVGS